MSNKIDLHTPMEHLTAHKLDALERLATAADRQAAALERIAAKLEQLQTQPPESNETVLREAESLPPDIPGREALTEAGFTSVNQLPTSGKDLEKIKGIGRVTANQILTYLKTR
jgi:transposase